MKMKSKIWTIVFGFFLTTLNVTAQEKLPTDPLSKFSNFFEIDFSPTATRVNTNYTVFYTSSGKYNFHKNNFLPSLDGCFSYGWLFKDKESSFIWTLKTGVNLLNRNADLTSSTGSDLRFNTGYLQIPIQIGFRSPLKYNTIKNNLYRAFEFNAGVYTAIPLIQKLDNPDNIDAVGETLSANYLRFGMVGEIVFTALDNKGHGHKFGIRVSNDFPTILKIKETPSELYPYYYTMGVFYNITNIYK